MPEKTDKNLSLIIPVYNEKSLISDAISRCIRSLESNFSDFEIIIVDDGSDHEDASVIDQVSGLNDKISIIRNSTNQNIGVSIQKGFEAARKEYVTYNSIDLPLAPGDIPGLIKKIERSDMLVLQRKAYNGATTWRRITSIINFILLRILFPIAGMGIRDFNYTFIFKRSAWDKIKPMAKSPAFTQPEIILRARYNGLTVNTAEVDYHARPQGKGSLGKPGDIMWSLSDMVKFRFMSHKNRP